MEFYSATRKNEILSFTSKRMELENIIFIKVSQAQKAFYRTKTNAALLLDMGHTLRGE
jgi:hypothetical protein